MASRTSSGGDYDLSDPVASFADVVGRVVLRPQAFFAGLPRQGSLLGPLVFALVCIEVSVLLVGLLTFLDVPGGATTLVGVGGDQGFLAFLGGLVVAPIAGAVGVREMHATTTGKALLVVLLPAILVLVLVVVVVGASAIVYFRAA